MANAYQYYYHHHPEYYSFLQYFYSIPMNQLILYYQINLSLGLIAIIHH